MKPLTKANAKKAFDIAMANVLKHLFSRNYKVLPNALRLAADMATVLAEFHEPKPAKKKGK